MKSVVIYHNRWKQSSGKIMYYFVHVKMLAIAPMPLKNLQTIIHLSIIKVEGKIVNILRHPIV